MLLVRSFLIATSVLTAYALSTTESAAATPSSWWSGLEDYSGYHSRYLTLDCQDKHNTSFFQSCCHPRLKNESMTSAPTECTPSGANSAGSSVFSATLTPPPSSPSTTSAGSDGSSNSSGSDDDDDGSEEECESDDDDDDDNNGGSSAFTGSLTLPPSTSAVPTGLSSSNPTPSSGSSGNGSSGSPDDDDNDSEEECESDDDGDSNGNGNTGDSSSSGNSSSGSSGGSFGFGSGSSGDSGSASSQGSASPPQGSGTSTSTSAPSSPSTNSNSSSGSSQVYTGGNATYYTQGGQAGACGKVHSDSDLICAMDQNRYGDSGKESELCGKQVHITNTKNGKTVTVTVADDCPTCNNENSIDLSEGAFTQIATTEEGEVPIDWYFAS